MTNPVETVEQVDRVAAAKATIHRWSAQHGGFQSWMTAAVAPILIGSQDSSEDVQAFARHRRTAIEAHDQRAGEGDRAIAEAESRRVCVEYRLSPEAYERHGGKHPLQPYIEEAILRALATLRPTSPVASGEVERLVDGIAGALAVYSVAYSHDTMVDMSTANRRWIVHRSGNPFDDPTLIEAEFDNKIDAKTRAAELRRAAAMKVGEAILAALTPAGGRVAEGALADVAAERQRQINAEGWTPEHDDEHGKGELLDAALCYAQRRSDGRMFGYRAEDTQAPARWPWALAWWKPKDERRDLVRAAALIVAEIERLDRAALTTSPQDASS